MGTPAIEEDVIVARPAHVVHPGNDEPWAAVAVTSGWSASSPRAPMRVTASNRHFVPPCEEHRHESGVRGSSSSWC